MLFKSLIAFGLMCVSGTAQGAPAAEPDWSVSAKEHVRQTLKDPEAAQFRGLSLNGAFVCGEVNGKNSYGGYQGYQPFAIILGYGKKDDLVLLGGGVDASMIPIICKKP